MPIKYLKPKSFSMTAAVVAAILKYWRSKWTFNNVWVCIKCFEANPADDTSCKKCGEPKSNGTKIEPNALSHCPKCSEQKESTHSVCVNCSKKEKPIARVNPLPKPPRHGIDSKEMRIVLIGKTGAGKSSTANTLLNQKVFAARSSLKSVTEKCQYHFAERWSRKLLIVDTPGLFDTSVEKDIISNEIKKSIAISAPGPHAFLLVASLTNRFTQEEQDVLKELDGMFGQHMMRYLIVVFTGRDQIETDFLEGYVKDSPEVLTQVLKTACGGYITFNNRGSEKEKEKDARKLYDQIEKMVEQNGGNHFTSEMYKEAEEIMQHRIAKELEERERQLRQEIEEELRREMEEIMRKEREYFQGLHEANVWHMEQLKQELKAEKEKATMTNATEKQSGEVFRQLVREEMEVNEKKNKIIQQIQNTDGAERVRMQHQLADVGEQIKQIVAKRNSVQEEVTNERMSSAVILRSQVLREEEREKVEKEEETILSRLAKGIKNLGAGFLNLFK